MIRYHSKQERYWRNHNFNEARTASSWSISLTSPACILKAKQPRLPRARLGTVSGCHWTCIWIIQSYSAIFFFFFFFKKEKPKTWCPGVIRHAGYKIRTSVPQSPPLSESVPLLPPPPPHPTSLLLWFSTLPTQYGALSLLRCMKYWASALTGLIRWLENMWLSAFQAQAPFLAWS